jgi:threonine/homoserine/homoserine lactone efflux protein
LLVILFSRVTAFARNGRTQRLIKGVTGMVFIGFGAKLAVTRL